MRFYNQKEDKTYEIQFNLLEHSDWEGFQSCIEEFYGKGYPYRKYLDGSFLEEETAKGNLIVVCGKDGKDVIATSAVDFNTDFQKSGILMLRVVKEEYRGLGIGDRQQDMLLEQIKRRGDIISLYADVMMHNCVSQKSLIREGFVICGIRFSLYYSRIMTPYLHDAKDARLSQAVMCRKENSDAQVDLFCPQEHRFMVKTIYQKLGAACHMEDSCIAEALRKKRTPKNTIVTVHTDKVHDSTTILVVSIGMDFAGIVENLLQKKGQEKEHTFLCYLNLKDCNAVRAYRLLRRKQFFFSGMKPLNENGEFMMLSNIGSKKIPYGEIALHEAGNDLLDYIKERRELL